MSRLLAALSILLAATIAGAVPVAPPVDTQTFVAKSKDILIVRCLNPDVRGGAKTDGLTLVEVEVVVVIKGDRKAGKARLGTIGQPMETGKRYLMASFGGDVFDTGFLAQSDQAVVELPADFDLKSLSDKTAVQQAQAIFDARRAQVERLLLQLQREKKVLDHTVPQKPGADRSEEAAEWKKLEGTWRIVILDSDGERFEGGFSSFDSIVIEKRKLIAKGAQRTQEWGTLTIDLSTSPKLMDLKEATEAAKGNTAEGIYEVEGDRLRICLDRRRTDVKERPSQFPKEPQKGVLFVVLEREKR